MTKEMTSKEEMIILPLQFFPSNIAKLIFSKPTKRVIIMTIKCTGENSDSDSVFSDRVQCSESVFRVLVKKAIIMHIHKNNVYWLGTMDQDADSVWVMTLNCLGCINTYSQ